VKEHLETVYPAETLYRWTVTTPAKRLLGIAAARYGQVKEADLNTKISHTMKKTSIFTILLLLTIFVSGQVNKLSIGIISSPDFYNYQFKSISGFDHEYKTKTNFSLGLSTN
jgi:hypothetical protein